jgi:uncharacterized membrane protein (DUF4010 family)
MLQNLTKNRYLWLSLACLALLSSVVGVFRRDIYAEVVSREVLPGTISQDVVTIILALALLVLSLTIREEEVKRQIAALVWLPTCSMAMVST